MPLIQFFQLEGKENIWAAGETEPELDRLALSLLRKRYSVRVDCIVVAGQECGFCLQAERDPAEKAKSS